MPKKKKKTLLQKTGLFLLSAFFGIFASMIFTVCWGVLSIIIAPLVEINIPEPIPMFYTFSLLLLFYLLSANKIYRWLNDRY